jgi:putative membrane protein
MRRVSPFRYGHWRVTEGASQRYPMPEPQSKESMPADSRNRRVHMANERTFLAWIRTSLGIMAFGFVVERFALVLKQVSFFLGKSDAVTHLQTGHSHSLIFGILLVGIGVLISVLAFFRYKRVQRQIDEDSFNPSSGLDLLVTLSVVGTGLFLIGFLVRSL